MWGNAALRRQLELLELKLTELSTKHAQLCAQVERSSGARLAAELEDLRGAADLTNKAMRRELGRLWKRVGDAEAHAEAEAPPETADAVRAKLRAQIPIPRIGAAKE